MDNFPNVWDLEYGSPDSKGYKSVYLLIKSDSQSGSQIDSF